jgi:hypothetical protein
MDTSSPTTGKSRKDVPGLITTPSTHARVVEAPAMALRNALKRSLTATPYKVTAWRDFIAQVGLASRYPNFVEGLTLGFRAFMPPLVQTFTPPNHPSVQQYKAVFDDIVHKKPTKQQYIGPLIGSEIQQAIRHFQTSPLSLIPKLGRPGKYRMIQDLSHPQGSSPIQSINVHMSPDDFTATYSTFPIVALLLSSLPPGSQGAVRDVAEAYCTVPVHPSQWHGLVVRLSDSHFTVDTALCFSFAPSVGIYGNIASAGTDIMQFVGMGPILRWVDDHLFIHIPRSHLHSYNKVRRNMSERIALQGGPVVHGSRCWFKGGPLPDSSTEEFDEDCDFTATRNEDSAEHP